MRSPRWTSVTSPTRTATTSRRWSTASGSHARIAEQEPLKSWLKREIAPGPDVTSDEALSEYGRRAAHTVYHPAGTCAIGSVVDGDLRVIGLDGLRVIDASVFPTMPTVNPMVTVLMIGERAADLIKGT